MSLYHTATLLRVIMDLTYCDAPNLASIKNVTTLAIEANNEAIRSREKALDDHDVTSFYDDYCLKSDQLDIAVEALKQLKGLGVVEGSTDANTVLISRGRAAIALEEIEGKSND
jgi:hypothetical protein